MSNTAAVLSYVVIGNVAHTRAYFCTYIFSSICRVLKEQQDQFMQRLEQTLLLQKTKTPNKSSPKLARRSPRLSLQQKQNGASPKLREDDLLGADETLISGIIRSFDESLSLISNHISKPIFVETTSPKKCTLLDEDRTYEDLNLVVKGLRPTEP